MTTIFVFLADNEEEDTLLETKAINTNTGARQKLDFLDVSDNGNDDDKGDKSGNASHQCKGTLSH